MNNKLKNIEQLYSESFNNFRVEPSSGLWKSISSKLAWRNFFTFNPATLNAYYIAGIIALTTAGVLLITKPLTDNNQNINEITINNAIEKPVINSLQENETEPKKVTIPEESRKPEAGSQKQEANNQKPKSGINGQTTQHLAPRTHLSTEALAKVEHPEPVTRNTKLVTLDSKLVTPNLEPVTTIIPQLATPHPIPHTQNPPSTQNPASSTDLPDPWPNMDSLFVNFNTPSPPQHSIQFPNAFTPNSNGPTNGYYTPGLPNNDVFYPVHKGVVEYHLRIFNRRGELIFESNDINVGWDGYINDRLAAQSVYIWKARGRYINGQSFTKLGNVMLIKK